jgi:large subunit ribosomal protein L22
MEVVAHAKYVRRAPRKARLVADMVRGQRVVDALAQLEFLPKHAARDVSKAIKSAAANAEHNHNLSRDDLWLKQIVVDNGPIIKRLRPVSRGMAHWYFHRTCHITAIVEDRVEPAVQRRGPTRRTRQERELVEVEEPRAERAEATVASEPEDAGEAGDASPAQGES